MRTDYLMEGEILEDYESDSALGSVKPSFSSYNVRVTQSDGTISILPNVPVASMFGGIGDSLNIVARMASANGQDLDGSRALAPQMNASVGDRVIVAFLGGHYRRPIIIGYVQHPAQLPKYTDRGNLEPQASLDYLGMTFNVDELGQLSVIHRGAPEVKYVEQSALSSLLGTVTEDNPALDPDDDSVTTKMEFLKEGGFRVRDSSGNTVWIDPDNQKITITDVGMPSTDDEEPQTPLDMTLPSDASRILEKEYLASEGESIVIDGAESSITIYSSDAYKKVIGGDVTNDITGDITDKIGGSSELTISEDQTVTIHGNQKLSVSEDSTIDISGSYDFSVDGDISFDGSSSFAISSAGDFSVDADGNVDIKSEQDMTLSASGGLATLKLAQGGKFEITGSAGGLVDLITQILDAISQMTVATSTGPSSVPVNVAQFEQIKILLTQMKA